METIGIAGCESRLSERAVDVARWCESQRMSAGLIVSGIDCAMAQGTKIVFRL